MAVPLKVFEWRSAEAAAHLRQGCYVLRSNVADWDAEELWHAYMHLTDAEAAFRIQKMTCGCGRSGTRKRSACRRIFWSASWPM